MVVDILDTVAVGTLVVGRLLEEHRSSVVAGTVAVAGTDTQDAVEGTGIEDAVAGIVWGAVYMVSPEEPQILVVLLDDRAAAEWPLAGCKAAVVWAVAEQSCQALYSSWDVMGLAFQHYYCYS